MSKKIINYCLTGAIVIIIFGGVYYFLIQKPVDGQANNAPSATLSEADQKAVAAKAAAGDVQAQLQMGKWGIDKALRPAEYRAAADWLQKAADAGNAEAQYQLGALYQAGRLSGQDPTNAVYWLEKAAAQHHVAALYNLGTMYGTGRGAKMDPPTAVRYFREAAELGDAYAQYNLARRCEDGHGTPRDLVEAWKWYSLAGSGGLPSANDGKRALEARLSPEQLDQARKSLAAFQAKASAPAK